MMAKKKKTQAEPIEKNTTIDAINALDYRTDMDKLTKQQLIDPTPERAGEIHKAQEAITKGLRDFMK